MLKKLLLLFILAGLLIGCKTSTPQPASDTPNTPSQPSPGTSTITGILYMKTTEGEKPYVYMGVYLGEIIKDSLGNETIAGVDSNSPLQDGTDFNGYFEIKNVPPGRYILAAMLPPKMMIKLDKPDGSGDMIIVAVADQIIDLGRLGYDFSFPSPETPVTYPLPENTPTPIPTPYP